MIPILYLSSLNIFFPQTLLVIKVVEENVVSPYPLALQDPSLRSRIARTVPLSSPFSSPAKKLRPGASQLLVVAQQPPSLVEWWEWAVSLSGKNITCGHRSYHHHCCWVCHCCCALCLFYYYYYYEREKTFARNHLGVNVKTRCMAMEIRK